MVAPSKINFKVYQGTTFNEVIRWESSKKVYKPITAISQAAPCIITSPSHGIPDGWRAKVTNAGGMKEINHSENYHVVTKLTSDTVELNAINSLGYTTYTSGGVLEYNEPINLTGFAARMQLRTRIEDATPLDEFTTENGRIIIDTAKCTIAILIPATVTALYDFSTVLYSLELIAAGGQVTTLVGGNLTLVREVTR